VEERTILEKKAQMPMEQRSVPSVQRTVYPRPFRVMQKKYPVSIPADSLRDVHQMDVEDKHAAQQQLLVL
jgi:hypothetical protein